jgi:hypothetical protein
MKSRGSNTATLIATSSVRSREASRARAESFHEGRVLPEDEGRERRQRGLEQNHASEAGDKVGEVEDDGE